MTTIMTSLSVADATTFHKGVGRGQILCRKKDRDRDGIYPYKVVEITPPPRSLGVRCFPQNLQCGESVTIEGQAYTISAVTHRYQLRKGKYEPSETRLDVLSTGRREMSRGGWKFPNRMSSEGPPPTRNWKKKVIRPPRETT